MEQFEFFTRRELSTATWQLDPDTGKAVKVQVQSYNQASVRRYNEFKTTLGYVLASLSDLKYAVSKMSGETPPCLQVPSKQEVQSKVSKAEIALRELHTNAKKYEVELQSRLWRV